MAALDTRFKVKFITGTKMWIYRIFKIHKNTKCTMYINQTLRNVFDWQFWQQGLWYTIKAYKRCLGQPYMLGIILHSAHIIIWNATYTIRCTKYKFFKNIYNCHCFSFYDTHWANVWNSFIYITWRHHAVTANHSVWIR